MVAEQVHMSAVIRPATAVEIFSKDCAGPIVLAGSRGNKYLLIIIDPTHPIAMGRKEYCF